MSDKPKRKPLSKRTRNEVFKRDSFTCQYCGRSVPEVILEVDHIKPVAKGGTNRLLNLITSCRDCNQGKGARELSDDTVVKQQMRQLREDNERVEQIKLVGKHAESLLKAKDAEIDVVISLVEKITGGIGYVSNAWGEKQARKDVCRWLRKFTLKEIVDATPEAFNQYWRPDPDPNDYDAPDGYDTFFDAIKAVPKIAGVMRSPDRHIIRRACYAAAIIKNKFDYVKPWELSRIRRRFIEVCKLDESSIERLVSAAKNVDCADKFIDCCDIVEAQHATN